MKPVFWLSLLFALFAGGLYGYAMLPGSAPAEMHVIIRKGAGFRGAVTALEQARVIRLPWVFTAVAAVTGQGKKFKAGEYAIPVGATPEDIMQKLVSGEVVVHKLTIPEGLTSAQIIALINAESILEGDAGAMPAEGSLQPETYHFTYGDTRAELVKRMQAAMQTTLDTLWATRSENYPLSREQWLILASIVESETPLALERPVVASAYLNRLKIGMKLQADPTVAYAIGKPGKPLALRELEIESPYNSYLHEGLPPGPITNPGRASLDAALHPAQTHYLYFVATGTGGHRFAATLVQHEQNVAAYRVWERERASAAR